MPYTDHATFIFIGLAVILFAAMSWRINLVTAAQQEDVVIERDLLSACQSGIAAAGDGKGTRYFGSERAREDTINAFYLSLEDSLLKHGYEADLVKYYVPCVFLVDSDGYYVEYTKAYTDVDSTTNFSNMITGLNTWSKSYNGYTVRFYLSDQVDVSYVTPNGYQIINLSGDYSDIYNKARSLNTSAIPALSFMSSSERFEQERNSVIVGIIQDQINYYVNTHNEFKNFDSRDYTFYAPTTEDITVARLLDHSSVIAFFQGMQRSMGWGYVNAYTLTGTIEDQIEQYYVDSQAVGSDIVLHYHKKGCLHIGSTIFQGSMDECAKMGAIPCPDCIR